MTNETTAPALSWPFKRMSETERKAMVYTTFAAAIFAFIPGEWEAGLVLLVLSTLVFRANKDLFKKKKKDEQPATEQPATEQPVTDQSETSTVPTEPGDAASR